MRPRLLPVLVAALSAVCAWLAVTDWRLTQELRNLSVRLTHEIDVATAAVRSSQEAGKRLEDVEAAARQRSKLTAAPENPARRVTHLHISEIVKQHPEYVKIYEHDLRREIQFLYGPALDALHLPPETVATVKALLLKKREQEDDAGQAAVSAGMSQGSSDYREPVAQAGAEYQTQINTMIGADGASALKLAAKLPDFRDQVQQWIAPTLAEANLPLDPDKTEALAGALATVPERQNPSYITPDATTGLNQADQNLLATAAKLLSPEQLEVMRQLRIEKNLRMKIMREYLPSSGSYTLEP